MSEGLDCFFWRLSGKCWNGCRMKNIRFCLSVCFLAITLNSGLQAQGRGLYFPPDQGAWQVGRQNDSCGSAISQRSDHNIAKTESLLWLPLVGKQQCQCPQTSAACRHRTERHILSQRRIESPLFCRAQPATGGHTLRRSADR